MKISIKSDGKAYVYNDDGTMMDGVISVDLHVDAESAPTVKMVKFAGYTDTVIEGEIQPIGYSDELLKDKQRLEYEVEHLRQRKEELLAALEEIEKVAKNAIAPF